MEAREGLAQVMRRVSYGVRGVANGDTEDVVQEAVARALKSGVSLEAEQWLRTVAKRVAIDKHRRRREMPYGAPTDLERWTTGSDDPEDAFIRAERSQAVRDALKELPPRYQKALLAYAEEDSPAAVARRLGLSATATWTLLSRARSRLKLQLEQVGFVPAMVFSGNRPRLRTLLAAGAIAATATGAVMIPKAPTVPGVDRPSAPKVVALEHSVSRPKMPKVSGAATDLLPVAPEEVTEKVDGVVDGTDKVQTSMKVGTCLIGQREVGVELSVVSEQKTLLSRLTDALVPEPLREIGTKAC
jgi:RNA polymerase sigma factor (sigma-70 family)